ncbi:hypothetical protein DL96DRAFT_1041234 [Flagelloscypha sp. PMI_526]|nr:hypothetical protein DL96DRAFT_1041234 [Flagelloscypha sp. PMI_526]
MASRHGPPTATWTSQHSNWLARATPIQVTTDVVSKENLLIGASVNAPVGTYPILGIFKPNIAILSDGASVEMKQEDADALVNLARKVAEEFPESHWRLRHDVSCRPIQCIHYPVEGMLKQISVYGYMKGLYELEASSAGENKLPEVVDEIFGLIEEASDSGRSESFVPNEQLKSELCQVL